MENQTIPFRRDTLQKYNFQKHGLQRQSLHKQYGASPLGTLIYILFGVSLVIFALRVLPVYLENMKLVSILESIADDYTESNQVISKTAIKQKLNKRFSIDSVSAINADEIEIAKEADGWLINAGYEKRVDLVANIDLMIDFTEGNAVLISRLKK